MNRPALVDTHCHLDFDRFDEDREAVLARAAEAGVQCMVTIGCSQTPSNADGALRIAQTHPGRIRATAGIHPHDATQADAALLGAIESVAQDPLVVAIGETGLDYFYDNAPREQQQRALRQQIEIACSVKKPLVIHTRNAAADTLRILAETKASSVGGIIHCFSEDAAFAAAALDIGFVSSFSGLVTFPKKTEGVRDAAKQLPLDALLVETDAPFLAPAPMRGKRNEPAWVVHVAAFIAELRGIDEDDLRAATTVNARRVLNLPPAQACSSS